MYQPPVQIRSRYIARYISLRTYVLGIQLGVQLGRPPSKMRRRLADWGFGGGVPRDLDRTLEGLAPASSIGPRAHGVKSSNQASKGRGWSIWRGLALPEKSSRDQVSGKPPSNWTAHT